MYYGGDTTCHWSTELISLAGKDRWSGPVLDIIDCPSQPVRSRHRSHGYGGRVSCDPPPDHTYGVNYINVWRLEGMEGTAGGFRGQMTRANSPANYWMIADSADWPNTDIGTFRPIYGYFRHDCGCWADGGLAGRHQGSINVWFLDGHAESVHYSRARSRIPFSSVWTPDEGVVVTGGAWPYSFW